MSGAEHNYYGTGCWCLKVHEKSPYQVKLEKALAAEKRRLLAGGDKVEPVTQMIREDFSDASKVPLPDVEGLTKLLMDVRLSNDFTDLIMAEVNEVNLKYAPMHSIEEAYAVIKEEFEEFWEEIRAKDEVRDWDSMATELVQTAAMCMRAYNDVVQPKLQSIDDEKVRKNRL